MCVCVCLYHANIEITSNLMESLSFSDDDIGGLLLLWWCSHEWVFIIMHVRLVVEFPIWLLISLLCILSTVHFNGKNDSVFVVVGHAFHVIQMVLLLLVWKCSLVPAHCTVTHSFCILLLLDVEHKAPEIVALFFLIHISNGFYSEKFCWNKKPRQFMDLIKLHHLIVSSGVFHCAIICAPLFWKPITFMSQCRFLTQFKSFSNRLSVWISFSLIQHPIKWITSK